MDVLADGRRQKPFVSLSIVIALSRTKPLARPHEISEQAESCADLDRYLSSAARVDPRGLQLVAATSLLIAAKFEEIYVPTLQELVRMTSNGYSTEEVKQMERLVLSTLGFELYTATPRTFLSRFAKVLLVPSSALC